MPSWVARPLANCPVLRYADILLMYAECADHWYDLLRWNDFVGERQRLLDKYDIGHSIPSMTPDSEIGNWKFTREVFEDGEKPDAHHMLLPYPYDEMTANPSLEQNPGY